MKTIEERARELVVKVSLKAKIKDGSLLSMIEDLLIEFAIKQDKIARHACAEKVLLVKTDEDENLDFCAGWQQAIDIAHNEIMNTKAV